MRMQAGDEGASHAVDLLRPLGGPQATKLAWVALKPVTGAPIKIERDMAPIDHAIVRPTTLIRKTGNCGGISNRWQLRLSATRSDHSARGVIDASAPLRSHMLQAWKRSAEADRFVRSENAPGGMTGRGG